MRFVPARLPPATAPASVRPMHRPAHSSHRVARPPRLRIALLALLAWLALAPGEVASAQGPFVRPALHPALPSRPTRLVIQDAF